MGGTNAQLLGRMGDAGLNFADALRHVVVAARPLTDWLGDVVVRMSEYVKNSARAGRETGDLAAFFKEAKDTLKVVGPLLGNLAKGLWNVIQVGRPLGDDILKTLRDSAEEFRKWTESAKGQNAIAEWYRDARAPLEEAAKLIRDIGEAFFDLGADKGLTQLLRTLRKDILPVLVDVTRQTTRAFGPAFVDFIGEAIKAMQPLFGASGPLTLFVEGLTTVLRLFNKLIDVVPELGDLLATVLGAGAIARIFSGKGLLGGGVMKLAGTALLGKGAMSALGGGGAAAAGGAATAAAGGAAAGAAGGGMFSKAAGKLAATRYGGAVTKALGPILKSGIGKIGLVGAGITLFDKVAKGFEDRALESSPKLADRLQGFVDRSIGNLEFSGLSIGGGEEWWQKSLVDIFTGGSAEKEAAESVQRVVRGITEEGRTLTRVQAEQARGYADQLDLTKRQREELQQVIHAGRTTGKIKLLPDIAESGTAGQIRKVVREAKEAGMAIEKSQVRAWVASGKISVDEGARILRQIDKVNEAARRTERQRWVREGFGIGDAMTVDRKVTKTELDRIKQQLDLAPEKYRRAAGEATVAWAREERAKGKITKSEFQDIKRTVEKQVGDITGKNLQGLRKQAADSQRIWGQIAQDAKSSSGRVLDSWTFGLSRTAEQGKTKGGKFRNNLAQSFWGGANASAEAMGHMANETNKTLKSLGGAKGKDVYVAKFGKMAETSGGGAGAARQKGGIMVPGYGTGDKVPAMLEPGEVVINRKAVAAMGGAQKTNKINKLIPRFAAGGIVALGEQLQSEGYEVGEHPAFGGVAPVHVSGMPTTTRAKHLTSTTTRRPTPRALVSLAR